MDLSDAQRFVARPGLTVGEWGEKKGKKKTGPVPCRKKVGKNPHRSTFPRCNRNDAKRDRGLLGPP